MADYSDSTKKRLLREMRNSQLIQQNYKMSEDQRQLYKNDEAIMGALYLIFERLDDIANSPL